MKTILKSISFLFLLMNSFAAVAQISKDSIESMIKNKQFIFKATFVNPTRGNTRALTSDYDLTLKSDSLISFLPYFGRSTRAPLNSDDAGIMFGTADFDYSYVSGKKNSWIISMKVKDQTYLSAFNLTVFSNGSAILNTNSNFRDPISFRGNIVPLPHQK